MESSKKVSYKIEALSGEKGGNIGSLKGRGERNEITLKELKEYIASMPENTMITIEFME